MKRIRTAPWGGLFLVPLLLGGCQIMPSHIHSPSRLEAAEKAVTLLGELGEKAPELYAKMESNADSFEVEEDYLIDELAWNRLRANTNALPTMTWKQVLEWHGELGGDINSLERTFVAEANRYVQERDATKRHISDLAGIVARETREVKKAKDRVTAWNKQVALLQAAIASFPGLIGALSSGDSPEAALAALQQQASDTKIKYVDADGTEHEASIKEILEGGLSGLLDRAKQGTATDKGLFDFLSLGDAPGLGVEIASLALDLANIEKARADAKLTQIEERKQLFDRIAAEIRVARFLHQASNEGEGLTGLDGSAPSIAGSLERMLPAEVDSAALLLADLREFLHADHLVASAKARMRLALGRLAQKQSITESEFNDRAHRALLEAAAEGLVTFHKGGFKPEHATTIIRIAQLAFLGLIAEDE